MPLPDETRAQSASSLIKRFQANIKDEGPLIPSNSFGSAGKPRVSSGGTSSSSKPGEAGTFADLASRTGRAKEQERNGEGPDGSKPVWLRSAGLDAPPEKTVEKVEEPEPSNAEEKEGKAEEEEEPAEKPYEDVVFERPPSPPLLVEEPASLPSSPVISKDEPLSTSPVLSRVLRPIVTRPSLDLTSPEAVPGSADYLTSPRPNHASHSRSASVESLSSPITREGLSQPSSPAVESGRLSVPPSRDDSSPPPPVDDSSAPFPFPINVTEDDADTATADEPDPSPSKPAKAAATSTPTKAPRQSITVPRSPATVFTPTASFLAKTRPRVSSTTTSPAASTSSSPARSARTAPSAPKMSPSNSRTSDTNGARGVSPTNSVTSPRPPSAAKMGRARSSSITSNTTTGGGGATPRKVVPTTGTPRSRAAAAAAAKEKEGGAATATSPPKRTPVKSATPKASTLIKKTSPLTNKTTSTTSGSKAEDATSKSPPSASGVPAPGRKPIKPRVGLAGAPKGANVRGGVVATKPRDQADKVEEAKNEELESAPAAEEETSDVGDQEPPEASEKVFQGFGSRPVGKIGVPVVEDGEGGVRAFKADEVEAAGKADEEA